MSSSGLPYTDLFAAVEAGALASLHALLFGFKMDSLAMREARYTLLTEPHPQNGLTVLQFAIENYPQSSIKIVKALLEYGAGTELVDHSDSHGTPLWIAIKRKVDIEIIRSLLEYKADIFFKSNCSPFTEDEKGVIMNRDQDGFSILHLAVKVACNENILKLLIDSSGDSLLNDQSNRFKETPLMTAVKEKNVQIISILFQYSSQFELRDSEGLTAYEIAAKDQFVEGCLAFEGEIIETSLNASTTYHLEILHKLGNNWTHKNGPFIGTLQYLNESDDLLPIDGYWEWQTDGWSNWRDVNVFRLRRRIEIKEPIYLKEAIETASRGQFQQALTILLDGMQHERDPQMKLKSAKYFQRLLQRIEKTTPALGILDSLSRTSLVILNDDIINRRQSSDFDSEDSLMYCPACSHRFLDGNSRESHLKRCLANPLHRIIGDRYITTNASQQDLCHEECPICYEYLDDRNRTVVMNCLCRFHEKCIKAWLRRGKESCPLHCE